MTTLCTSRLLTVSKVLLDHLVFASGEEAYVQTCGGNVYDSNPEDEYEEIVRKFAGTKKVLDKFIVDDSTSAA